MKNTVIYPGTFDPITLGHIDLVERATHLFDHIVIAIADNQQKAPLFSLAERINLIKEVFSKNNNIEVVGFNGLVVDLAKQRKANIILRGLRVVSDFDYEFQMASMNRTLLPELETVFLMPSEKYTYISSTLVREVALAKGDVSRFVPPIVEKVLQEKMG
jgi:pantetheine-phosphate adenylyltransferase